MLHFLIIDLVSASWGAAKRIDSGGLASPLDFLFVLLFRDFPAAALSTQSRENGKRQGRLLPGTAVRKNRTLKLASPDMPSSIRRK